MKTTHITTCMVVMLSCLMLPIFAQQPKVRLQLPAGLSEAQIGEHVIAPSHLKGIQMEIVDTKREVRYNLPALNKTFKLTPKLDVGALGLALHTILKDSVTGYILQIRQNGKLIHTGIWNWAQTPSDGNKGWTEDTRMHVASVSKFLTAIAMVKALDSKNISYDEKISGYLPAHWAQGPNVSKITFRHLLTHMSGFNTGSSASDYAFMKDKVAAGVSKVGSYDYENMNFGLCRILIPIVMGDLAKTATFVNDKTLNDKTWDAVTIYHYKNYMQSKVFTPAGVSNASFAPSGNHNALAYAFPHANKKGWNSGDLTTMAGGAAWRLSAKELLNVMHHVRRKNTILDAPKTQYLLDNFFGIDQVIDTPAGKIYNKNGAWISNGRKEQCVAYFLPHGMELILFVNSPIGSEDFSLRGLVKDAFINSLSD